MSTIRRQSIISSILIYIGFVLGFFNTWLFAHGFTEAQYGLTGTFIAIANIMFSFANLGMLSYINKFYPYYKGHLPPDKNDLMTFALVTSLLGFVLILISGFFFKDLIIKKFGTNSPDLVKYYYWLFPFGFGLTLYSLLEVFAWQFAKAALTSFLREILFRLFATLLICLSFIGVLNNFDLFIKIYAMTYIAIALILLIYLVITRKLHITFSISRVTKKFFKKIVALIGFIWAGGLVLNIAQMFDTLVIAAVIEDGLKFAGIYTLAQNMASLVQAPQRAIIAASIGPLSEAWKRKDYARINTIYQRSSINQLLFAVGMFALIWINFTDGILTLQLKKGYLEAQYVFLFIGLMRVIDLGTGVNAQIIGTSIYWRFEFLTGIILLALALPLNYFLAKRFGVIGPAISNLIAFSIYNGIRYSFLLKKFNLQPFNLKTLYTLLLGAGCFLVCHLLFHQYIGLGWIILRSVVFLAMYIIGAFYLNLTPDLVPVWSTIKQRLKIK
jgi:O-antigen/teichoic acid export membrane protein